MPVVQLGALVALALAAAGPERLASADEVAAAGRPPAATVMGSIPPASSVVMGALPIPPKKVVLQTKTYGTVTVDHAAHLARRTACRSCHGDGPVSKIGFTARQAHDTCRACHVDLQKGPTDCRGCHAIAPAPAAVTALAAPPDGGGKGASSTASSSLTATDKAAPSPATSALPAPPPPPAGGADLAREQGVAAAPSTAAGLPPPPPPPPLADWDEEYDSDAPGFHQSIEAGMVVRGGWSQSALFGPSIELTSRRGRALLVHHVESAGGLRSGRALLMVGGGAVLPIRPRMALLVVGTGGVDALGSEARLLPAASIRVGLQWTRAVPHVELLSVSVSGISDLVRQHDSRGEQIGDLTFSLGLSAGFGFGGNR